MVPRNHNMPPSCTMKSILNTVKSRYDRTISERTQRLDPDVRRELADEVEAALNINGGRGENGPSKEAGSSVSPVARAALTSDDIDSAIGQIDDALVMSRAKLAELERSEQFVGVRYRRYRLALEDRAAELDRLSRAAAVATEIGDEATVPKDEDAVREHDDVEGGGDSGRIFAERLRTAVPVTKPPKSAQELAEMQEKQAKDEQALEKVKETHRKMLEDVERMRRKIFDLEVKRENILTGRDMARDFLIAAAEAEELEAAGEFERSVCPLTLSSVARGPCDAMANEDDETRGTAQSKEVSG
jgi:hypothetical protein